MGRTFLICARGATSLLGLLVLLVVGGAALSARGDEQLPTAEEITKAWAERPRANSSFEYFCRVFDHFKRAERVDRPNDPFGGDEQEAVEKHGGAEQGFAMRATFKMRGVKHALLTFGEAPTVAVDGTTGQMNEKRFMAFDGAELRSLVESDKGPRSWGYLERGVEVKFNGDLCMMPIWLWHDPVPYLERLRFDLRSLTVVPRGESDGDDSLVKVTVVGIKHLQVHADFLVEREAPYLIRELSLRNGDELLQFLKIGYEAAPGELPAISWWEHTQYDDKGRVTSAKTGKALKFIDDARFEDSEFVVTFPVDTPVSESDPRRAPLFYKALADGSLKRISDKEHQELLTGKKSAMR